MSAAQGEPVTPHAGEGAHGSPFAGVGPTAAFALTAIVASIVWRLAGSVLPGGRWPAVHLFTLGALTPLIAMFMTRFASALLHARPGGGDPSQIRAVLLAAGATLVVAGRLTFSTPLLTAGATLLAVAVGWLYVALRTLRRGALPARFGFIVRSYERACGAFLHGALLGALVGAGVFRGAWYASARAAHLQLMLLGWAGITLLATIVMFGPAAMRVRIAGDTEAVAARWLPRAAVATTVAALALLAMGAGGSAANAGRVVAAIALSVYAWTVVRICAGILRTARRAAASAARSFVSGACGWFVLASSLNAASAAFAKPQWMDAAVVALLAGVFLQAILASLTHVIPLLVGRDARQRGTMSSILSMLGRTRAAALSAGTALAVAGTGWDPSGPLPRTGWALAAAAIAVTITLGAIARWTSRVGR